jgi:hypothetical protein
VFNEIAITLDDGSAPARFRLATKEGQPPRVTMLVVVEAATETPVWCLMPVGGERSSGVILTEVTDADIRAFSQEEMQDPLEDLPPSDPRHQWALREHERVQSALLIPVDLVTYGIVPPGFQQAMPERGSAPALKRGSAYVVQAMGGGDAGHLEFEAW